MVETRSHELWDLIPLGESVKEEALLDVVSLIEWHVVRSAVPVA